MAAEAVRFHKPGEDLSCRDAVGGLAARAVAIVGNRTGGPALSTDLQNVYNVGAPAAGGRILGVRSTDVAAGGLVNVMCDGVVPIEAAANIAAFAEVEVNALGQIITRAAGIPIGFVMSAVANGARGEVKLYNSGSIA